MNINLAGMTFLEKNTKVELGAAEVVHDKTNKFDNLALSVRQGGKHIGFIPSKAFFRDVEKDIKEVKADIEAIGRRNQFNAGRLKQLNERKSTLETAKGEMIHIRQNWERAKLEVVAHDLSYYAPYISVEVRFEM